MINKHNILIYNTFLLWRHSAGISSHTLLTIISKRMTIFVMSCLYFYSVLVHVFLHISYTVAYLYSSIYPVFLIKLLHKRSMLTL